MVDDGNWVSGLSQQFDEEDIRYGSLNTRLLVRSLTLGFAAFVTASFSASALTNPVELFSFEMVLAFSGFLVTFLHVWEFRKDNAYGLVVLQNDDAVSVIAEKS
jgi:hypothetical protein